MTEEKEKYKVGDKFDCVVEIIDVDEDEDGALIFKLAVNDINIGVLEEWYSKEELDQAFCPAYKERMRQERIKELKSELEGLENE